MAAPDYLTLDELKVASETIGVSFIDYDGKRSVTAASRAIEEYCGRRFWLDADTTNVRYFTPLDNYSVQVDDLVSLGTVQVDYDGAGTFSTPWAATDFTFYPLNAAADGKPYEELRLRRPAYSYPGLPCWEGSVKVTGQFGWPDVPEQVKSATTLLATKLVKRVREAPFGVVSVIDNLAIRVISSDPEFRMLLDPLIRGQGVMLA